MQFQFSQREQFRWGQKQSHKQRLSYLFAHFSFIRTQTPNSMLLRPTSSDRQGQWWNTGHVFQDRSSAKAKIQLLEYMLIVNIWSTEKILCSISYLFIVMSRNTSLYYSYLMISFHPSCVGNQTQRYENVTRLKKKIQSRLLCLRLSQPSILDGQARQGGF